MDYVKSYTVDKFDGSEWVKALPAIPPPTIGYLPMKPNTESQQYYEIYKLTEPGLYRVHQQFSYADVKEDKTYEFTLE